MDIRKKFLSEGSETLEVEDASPLGTFKVRFDWTLSNVI